VTLLSKQNLQWQELARTVAEEVVRPVAAKYDRAQEYPWEIKEAMQQKGLMVLLQGS
jgi:alkylation response protein AidB-like acyl-CoA dehydrogenase